MPDALVLSDSTMTPAFTCSWTGGLDDACVHVSGELDLATTPQLERTLREAQLQARLCVLDLSGLEFMDSSGVHTILKASIRARQLGRRLVVMRGPPNVDRICMLTGTSDEVEMRDGYPDELSVEAPPRFSRQSRAA